MFEWFSEVFDVTLLATVGLIFLATLVGAYLRASRRDPCLKSFTGYNITLEQADGKIVWGVLELASTGLELRYASSVQDTRHLEQAWRLRFSLPDNGRRTQLLLQELARKESANQRYRVETVTDLMAAGGAYSLGAVAE